MKTKKQKFTCLDNGGHTYDRYTIIENSTGECVGASDEPTSPNGFGQYCGNIADNYMRIAYGYAWRKNCNVKACIKDSIERYLSDPPEMDKVIDFTELPEAVQNYANSYFN